VEFFKRDLQYLESLEVFDCQLHQLFIVEGLVRIGVDANDAQKLLLVVFGIHATGNEKRKEKRKEEKKIFDHLKNYRESQKERRMEREGETETQEVQPRAQGRDKGEAEENS